MKKPGFPGLLFLRADFWFLRRSCFNHWLFDLLPCKERENQQNDFCHVFSYGGTVPPRPAAAPTVPKAEDGKKAPLQRND
ncbi:MAG: hypothetical protein ABL893_20675 [Hyphomicrobium sp.]